MKRKFLSIALLLCVSFAATAQNVVRDANGNYTAVKSSKQQTPATNTGNTYTDTKGNVYPVLQSSTGKRFVLRTSKAGKEYKMYIKE